MFRLFLYLFYIFILFHVVYSVFLHYQTNIKITDASASEQLTTNLEENK